MKLPFPLLVIIVRFLTICSAQDAWMPGETPSEREARMAWWKDAKFGMFIHWGPAAVPAGSYKGKNLPKCCVWLMHRAKIPVNEYGEYIKQFNPTEFNAKEWVSLAKDAGMKYIVYVAKHHDGFAMFHSKVSPYNIVEATPWKRDPLAELAKECQKQGIKLGVYYSQAQDWFHPGGKIYDGPWDPAQEGSFDDYIDKIAIPQMRELLTNYGPISILWFDTPGFSPRATMTSPEQAKRMLDGIQDLQPGLIINNRLGGGVEGDMDTPEQFVPAKGRPGRNFETCMTINNVWGFNAVDNNWKSTRTLLTRLIDIASKGANLLLNVGPDAKGVIPTPSIERLKEIGVWMKVNGRVIYGSSASPFQRLPWGRATRGADGKLYLFVFEWPKDGKLLVPMENSIIQAALLTAPDHSLETAAVPGQGQVITLPAQAPDSNPVAIAVDIKDAIKEIPPAPIEPRPDGSFMLKADLADVVGAIALDGDAEKYLTRWKNPQDYIEWQMAVAKPGSYRVSVCYAADDSNKGAAYEISLADQALGAPVEPTSRLPEERPGDPGAINIGVLKFQTVDLGTIKIPNSGVQTLILRSTKKLPLKEVMHVREVTLNPENRE